MRQRLIVLLIGEIGSKSLSDYRRALLTANVIIVSLLTSIYYIIVNLIRNYNPSVEYYYIFVIVLIICFWLNRVGQHWLAKVILLTSFNLILFAFTSREPPVQAAFLFYIVSSLVALAIFDLKERYSAFFFVAISIVLYLVARYTTFSIVPSRPIDPEYLERAYYNNLIITYVTSVLTVYFLVRINHTVESSLQNRETQIMEKNKTLVKTNEELDRFIYSTSHDLRAPLNSIQGLINLCELSENKEELTLYHEMMRERLNKLESVLNEIMHYSKNAKLEVVKKEINLKEYINKALSDVQYMDGASRIQVNINVDDHYIIVTDSMRISIVLNNLISNSFKYADFTKDHSFITITASAAAGQHTIIIEDNGEGIDKAYQQKIFSMFYRATEKSNGSGLGLYLVKETVGKLGGTITLSSTRGVGTTFTVILPG